MTLRGGESGVASNSESENPSPDVRSCKRGSFGRAEELIDAFRARHGPVFQMVVITARVAGVVAGRRGSSARVTEGRTFSPETTASIVNLRPMTLADPATIPASANSHEVTRYTGWTPF
jgi:hypothetical protein